LKSVPLVRRAIIHFSAFIVLTLLTEIGGVIWLMAFAARGMSGWQGRRPLLLFFVLFYIVDTFLTQQIAPLFGRVPLSCFAGDSVAFSVRSPLFCVLNRNYVTPKMKAAAMALADHMQKTFPGTKTMALEANFPFINGFPLMPHLSHSDGRKLDIAFYYKDETGTFRSGETRSPIGYFAFEQPLPNSPQPCAGRKSWLSLRWDLAWLQPLFPDWHREDRRMKETLSWLSSEGQKYGVEKIFIEPHIPARLGVANDVIRFQGCRAARHDDHIHIQVR
jgi:hypothetical protein